MQLFVLACIMLIGYSMADQIPKDGHMMSGAPVNADPNSHQVKVAAQKAVDEYNKQHAGQHYFIKKIKSAKTHVVSGIIYDLDLEIVQSSECKKEEVCENASGPSKHIGAHVYTIPWKADHKSDVVVKEI